MRSVHKLRLLIVQPSIAASSIGLNGTQDSILAVCVCVCVDNIMNYCGYIPLVSGACYYECLFSLLQPCVINKSKLVLVMELVLKDVYVSESKVYSHCIAVFLYLMYNSAVQTWCGVI